MIDTTQIKALRGRRPLYCQYPRQSAPQHAFIAIDEEGMVSAAFNTDIGNAVPSAVWNGHTLRMRVSSNISAPTLRAFIARSDVRTFLERIHIGHTIEWDGSNHKGRLTNDALSAFMALSRLIEAL